MRTAVVRTQESAKSSVLEVIPLLVRPRIRWEQERCMLPEVVVPRYDPMRPLDSPWALQVKCIFTEGALFVLGNLSEVKAAHSSGKAGDAQGQTDQRTKCG